MRRKGKLMAEAKRLQVVPSGMVRKRPTIWANGVRWPWLLTADQRMAVDNATRGERLDVEHYDRVLDARTTGRAQPRRRSGESG